MKKLLLFTIPVLCMVAIINAQVEPGAGNWKPWLISSVKEFRLPAPPAYKTEIAEVLSAQKKLNEQGMREILFWNAGSPGYRWHEMMSKVWVIDTGRYGGLANMLLGTAIYDATIAAWNNKYLYNRPRPYEADNKIKALVPKPGSPAYPCEHSIAAGVAVTIFSHFFPHLSDSVSNMAQKAMKSRIAAGLVFPSDTKAGFDLGRRIALKEIDATKNYITTEVWDGKMPVGQQYWKGTPMQPWAGKNKTIVLESGSQYRPPAPPDFTKDMAELKSFKSNFMTRSNAFLFASQNPGEEMLNKKIFEYNIHLNPPRAARIYAAMAVAYHDGFTACWDAKYAYWGTRPNQFDTTYKSLIPTPPFPGYPSGHAMFGALVAELLTYFFPADKNVFDKMAKDGAESRFHGGIHFRIDNEVGLDLGRRIGVALIKKLRNDGADNLTHSNGKNSGQVQVTK